MHRVKPHFDRFVDCALDFRQLCLIAAILISAQSLNACADDSLFAPSSSSAQTVQSQIQSNATTTAPASDRQIHQATHLDIEPSRINSADAQKSLPLPAAEYGDSHRSSGGSALGAIFSVLFSLALVLGLFMLIAWLTRRGLPKSSTRLLPLEAVDVLGRAPLVGRQQMHLIRLGNKLLLVCISPNGVDTLGEVTDPAEVDRLIACCSSGKRTSASATGLSIAEFFGQKMRKSLPNSAQAGEVQNA